MADGKQPVLTAEEIRRIADRFKPKPEQGKPADGKPGR